MLGSSWDHFGITLGKLSRFVDISKKDPESIQNHPPGIWEASTKPFRPLGGQQKLLLCFEKQLKTKISVFRHWSLLIPIDPYWFPPPPPAIRLRPPSLTWPTNNPHPHSQHGECYGTTPNSLSGYETSSPKPCSRSCWPLWSVSFRVNLTINILHHHSIQYLPRPNIYLSTSVIWSKFCFLLFISQFDLVDYTSFYFHHVHIFE